MSFVGCTLRGASWGDYSSWTGGKRSWVSRSFRAVLYGNRGPHSPNPDLTCRHIFFPVFLLLPPHTTLQNGPIPTERRFPSLIVVLCASLHCPTPLPHSTSPHSATPHAGRNDFADLTGDWALGLICWVMYSALFCFIAVSCIAYVSPFAVGEFFLHAFWPFFCFPLVVGWLVVLLFVCLLCFPISEQGGEMASQTGLLGTGVLIPLLLWCPPQERRIRSAPSVILQWSPPATPWLAPDPSPLNLLIKLESIFSFH